MIVAVMEPISVREILEQTQRHRPEPVRECLSDADTVPEKPSKWSERWWTENLVQPGVCAPETPCQSGDTPRPSTEGRQDVGAVDPLHDEPGPALDVDPWPGGRHRSARLP